MWVVLCLIGYGLYDYHRNCIRLITGNIESVTQGAFDSAKEAVTLCITMFGIMAFWCGLMEIAEKSDS